MRRQGSGPDVTGVPVAVRSSRRRILRARRPRAGNSSRITATIVGMFVLLLAVLWLRRGPAPATSVEGRWRRLRAEARQATADASTSQPAALPHIGRDRPFLDAAGEGAAAYEAGDFATSLAKFQAAIERNPQDTDSLSNLGQVLVKMNRPADAIPYLTRAVALAPDRWAYQFNLARALGLVGRLDESIQGYRVAQELFPTDYVTTFNLALALAQARRRGGGGRAVSESHHAAARGRLVPESAGDQFRAAPEAR